LLTTFTFSGHSAVRLVVLEALTNFLNHGITPIVPLRGTISASGDLSPLSYIAAAISGHPDSKVHVVHEGKEKIMYAREAMTLYGLEPVVLGPKEGLGLVNGTAVSASMATLALHDAHMLSLLSQSLTAMTVEAMVGHAGSFHPFLHDVTRPHPTQIEVAGNIRKLLEGSHFAVHHEEEVKVKDDEGILRQDRYPLRTSPQVGCTSACRERHSTDARSLPQWLGPLVSDLIHAHAVLTIEAGQSTTDNPLIDVENKTSHHGGNFQAAAVANTMEKTRCVPWRSSLAAFSANPVAPAALASPRSASSASPSSPRCSTPA
jgi:phenylalanine ammonia-lyase